MNSHTASICCVSTMPFSRSSFSIWARLFSDVHARFATKEMAISAMISPANFVFSLMFPMTLPSPSGVVARPHSRDSSSSNTSTSRAHTSAANAANDG